MKLKFGSNLGDKFVVTRTFYSASASIADVKSVFYEQVLSWLGVSIMMSSIQMRMETLEPEQTDRAVYRFVFHRLIILIIMETSVLDCV